MPDVAIKVENLAKLYQIGAQKNGSLRETLAGGLRKIVSSGRVKPTNDFWALNDVSFEIKPGEAVGIIGKNGAGKSTLLKILSRITEPTKGRIEINGRVSSLLEVGTGFHPELTGRENVFLNGTIMGMTRREIKAKFDEIVDFSGVEKFIDTPVKFYSSGMYVRLAFAVAAHLEPEILIIDEVLAVGDAEFQKKCLGKMGEVAGQGRTVIFVSHQMGAVTKLCSSAILMRQGTVDKVGRVDEVIAHYLNSINRTSDGIQLHPEDVDKDVFIESVDTMDETEAPCANFTHRNPIFVKLNLCLKVWRENMRVGLRVVDKLGRNIFTTEYTLTNQLQTGLVVRIPAGLLTPNSYYFSIGVYVPNVILYDLHDNIPAFNIIETGSDFEQYEGADYGCVFVNCEWNVATEITI